MRAVVQFLILCLVFLSATVRAEQGYAQLKAYPLVSVADGRSTVTITATVVDSKGKRLDGVDVLFDTTLGSFRESTVTTVNGTALAVLVAGGIPGTAKITVTPVGGSPTTLSYDFVASRKELDSAREYVEVFSPKKIEYTLDNKVIEASAADKGVTVAYRDVVITAEDIQYDINTFMVRARHAQLKIGRNEPRNYYELCFWLKERHGYGTTTYRSTYGQIPVLVGRELVFRSLDENGKIVPAYEKEKFGVVEIFRDRIRPPRSAVDQDLFEFKEYLDRTSSIAAERAVVFPQRGIQFQRAEIYVGEAKVIKLSLYELNFAEAHTPLITESLLNINDNQIALNYPHYLSLKPGGSSLLRFRTGERYGRSYGANNGAFLDYELNWSKGDDVDGNFTITGLARSDWGISARHFMRLDPQTTTSFSVDSPSHNGLVGYGSLGHQFVGFQMNLSGTMSRTWQGFKNDTRDLSLSLEKDPIKVGKLPITFTYGANVRDNTQTTAVPIYDDATSTWSETTQTKNQQGAGLSLRFQTERLNMSRSTTFSASTYFNQLWSSVQTIPLEVRTNLYITNRFSRAFNLTTTYGFVKGGFADTLGNHRISFQASYEFGNFTTRLMNSQTIDRWLNKSYAGNSQSSIFGDTSYRFNDKFRVLYMHTFNQSRVQGVGLDGLSYYRDYDFLDYSFALGYKVGWREVGLTWSNQTKRIGIQLLGTSF